MKAILVSEFFPPFGSRVWNSAGRHWWEFKKGSSRIEKTDTHWLPQTDYPPQGAPDSEGLRAEEIKRLTRLLEEAMERVSQAVYQRDILRDSHQQLLEENAGLKRQIKLLGMEKDLQRLSRGQLIQPPGDKTVEQPDLKKQEIRETLTELVREAGYQRGAPSKILDQMVKHFVDLIS